MPENPKLYVQQIGDYTIKDGEARASIDNLVSDLNEHNTYHEGLDAKVDAAYLASAQPSPTGIAIRLVARYAKRRIPGTGYFGQGFCLIDDDIACITTCNTDHTVVSGSNACEIAVIDITKRKVLGTYNLGANFGHGNTIAYNKSHGVLYVAANNKFSAQGTVKETNTDVDVISIEFKNGTPTLKRVCTLTFKYTSASGTVTDIAPNRISYDKPNDKWYISWGRQLFSWTPTKYTSDAVVPLTYVCTFEEYASSSYEIADKLAADPSTTLSATTQGYTVYDGVVYYACTLPNAIVTYDLSGQKHKVFNFPTESMNGYPTGELEDLAFNSKGDVLFFSTWYLVNSAMEAKYRNAYSCVFVGNLARGEIGLTPLDEKSVTYTSSSTIHIGSPLNSKGNYDANECLYCDGTEDYPFRTLDEASAYALMAGKHKASRIIMQFDTPDTDWGIEGLYCTSSTLIHGNGNTLGHLRLINGNYTIEHLTIKARTTSQTPLGVSELALLQSGPVYVQNGTCTLLDDCAVNANNQTSVCIRLQSSTLRGAPQCEKYTSSYAVYGDNDSILSGTFDDTYSVSNVELVDGHHVPHIKIHIAEWDENNIYNTKSTGVDYILKNKHSLITICGKVNSTGVRWSSQVRMTSARRDQYKDVPKGTTFRFYIPTGPTTNQLVSLMFCTHIDNICWMQKDAPDDIIIDMIDIC